MKPGFAESHLRCPVCFAERSLTLHADAEDEREVRHGELRCSSCGRSFPVTRGVAHLLVDPPDHVAREAAGLERFAEVMREQGWTTEQIRQLPDHDSGYWYVQRATIGQLLLTMDLPAGSTLVDVGSNTCWASNLFARRGLRPIALDISTAEFQGLYTADLFIGEDDVYFERVLGSMNEMPLASASVDFVFCCEVLHHNDSDGLRRTFREAHRVLKPGGKLLVVNETLKTLRDPHGVHDEAVEQFEGYEHAHWALEYRLQAMRAGFETRLLWPAYDPPRPYDRHGRAVRMAFLAERRALRTRGLRRAALMWMNHVAGGVQFSMVGTKRA